MPADPPLSVLVDGADPVRGARLCAEIDAQSLSLTRFEVLLHGVVAGPSTQREWARRRSNVVLCDDLPAALSAARGRWVVLLGPDDVLFAHGLRMLLETAETPETGPLGTSTTQAVVGVRNDDHRSAQWLTGPTGEQAARPSADGSIVAVDRGLLTSTGSVSAAVATAATVVTTARPVGRARHVARFGPAPVHSNSDKTMASWHDSWLRLAGTTSVFDPDQDPGEVGAAALAPPAVRLVARSQGNPQEVLLPARIRVERLGSDDGWRIGFDAELELDPASTVVPDGRWIVSLRLIWSDREAVVEIRRPEQPVSSALISGRPVTVRRLETRLQLDLSAATSAVVADLVAARCSLTETVAGLALRAELPALHVHGDQPLAGSLLVAGHCVPAVVQPVSGTAVLSALLVAPTGRAELATLFGGPRRPTGLDLELAADGTPQLLPHYREPQYVAPPEAEVRFPAPVPATPERRPAAKAAARPGPTPKSARPASVGLARRTYRSARRRLRTLSRR